MLTLRRVVRYGFIGGSVVGTGMSLHTNNYDISGIGIVRASRSGIALVEIAMIYQRELLFKDWDKSSKEYRDKRSIAHQKAADRLLKLCCLNRGVYIKVGQHIGSMEYLLPIEYVNTLKILHSKAPSNTLEEIYKVIRQDLRRDVSFSFARCIPRHMSRKEDCFSKDQVRISSSSPLCIKFGKFFSRVHALLGRKNSLRAREH